MAAPRHPKTTPAPTPEQIAERSAEIRATWPPGEEERRANYHLGYRTARTKQGGQVLSIYHGAGDTAYQIPMGVQLVPPGA